MKYPGLTYVGSERFSGLYGLNETIHDQKAIGLQHFYINDYQIDLVHTALSLITVDDVAYYGDRIKPKSGHPCRQTSNHTYVDKHSIFVDEFEYPKFMKTDSVATYDDVMYFQSEVKNTSIAKRTFKGSSLLITHPNLNNKVEMYNGAFIMNSSERYYAMIFLNAQKNQISLDAPSGFMYHGVEDILFNKNAYQSPLVTTLPVAMSLSETVLLIPNQSHIFKWAIIVGNNVEDLKHKIDSFKFENNLEKSSSYWKNWLGKASTTEESSTMLVALKSAMMDGFLPADLTGHYFASGNVCFYVRDALMASRAFLYSDHPEECKQIVHELLKCPRKENGEFYQRYNAKWLPDEGANNNVFSQIDVIGYFARVVSDYYTLHKEMIVPYLELKTSIDALENIQRKLGLFGPEGGVNEGVYGPAYIVSTNMFIVGGLLGAIDLATSLGHLQDAERWSEWIKESIFGIDKCFLEEGYFSYGYVEYHDELIRRYDTPQLLATSLGYPLNEKVKLNYQRLVEIARFFHEGIGYSEQEYHHGPWMFNTAAAGETAYLLNDIERYRKIRDWMLKHRNAYGLLPEAIDATNENHAFINPLMWANAEFICLDHMSIIAKLRK